MCFSYYAFSIPYYQYRYQLLFRQIKERPLSKKSHWHPEPFHVESVLSDSKPPHLPLNFAIAEAQVRPGLSPAFPASKKISRPGQLSKMSTIARAKSLDHLVLTVKDLDKTIKFYEQTLGMQHTSFASAGTPPVVRHALNFGAQKINLHISGQEFEPKAKTVQPGSGDLCL